ncbi:predicted protein [Postia placenta Mad-698-R]|nr:predicted protein [Postia placenta Mad-698-R]
MRSASILDATLDADHIGGILTVLRNALGIPPAHQCSPAPPLPTIPTIEIYGPRGLRRFVRLQMRLTHSHTATRYAVHELLAPGETPSVLAGAGTRTEDGDGDDIPLENEALGQDVLCGPDGFWRGIASDAVAGGLKSGGRVVVDAGPIQHRDPCNFSRVPHLPFHPRAPQPRTLVILGDTYDPSAIVPLIESPDVLSSQPTDMEIDTNVPAAAPPTVSLLVHEATDSYIPSSIDPQGRTGRNRSEASVFKKTLERGHSTPEMAGAFARRIGALRVVLNHIGARFPAPDHSGSYADKFRRATMREIERQATEAWQPPQDVYAQAAFDFMRVVLPPHFRKIAHVSESHSSYADVAIAEVETTWQQRTESGGEVKKAQGGMSMEEVKDRVVLGIGATHDRGESMIMEGDL